MEDNQIIKNESFPHLITRLCNLERRFISYFVESDKNVKMFFYY